jgi:hypothetical protein
MNELYLIFINIVGRDWKGVNLYEFIFSDTIEDIDGEEWDSIPAAGRPSSPHEDHVKKVGRLTTEEFKLHVIQNSDSFSVWDAIDGVVALGWEDMDSYDEYPEKRMAFHFGDTIKDVEDMLYEHDLILEYKKEIDVKLKKEDTE